MVEWESGEVTYEPLTLISKDDPITCAVYAKKHDLLDTTGWKHLKRYTKTSKRLIRAVKQSRIRQVRASSQFSYAAMNALNFCVISDANSFICRFMGSTLSGCAFSSHFFPSFLLNFVFAGRVSVC